MMVDELQKSFKAAEEILEQKRRQVLQAEKAAERERDRLALEWAWLRSQREVLTQERDAIHKMQVVLEAKHHALEEEREVTCRLREELRCRQPRPAGACLGHGSFGAAMSTRKSSGFWSFLNDWAAWEKGGDSWWWLDSCTCPSAKQRVEDIAASPCRAKYEVRSSFSLPVAGIGEEPGQAGMEVSQPLPSAGSLLTAKGAMPPITEEPEFVVDSAPWTPESAPSPSELRARCGGA